MDDVAVGGWAGWGCRAEWVSGAGRAVGHVCASRLSRLRIRANSAHRACVIGGHGTPGRWAGRVAEGWASMYPSPPVLAWPPGAADRALGVCCACRGPRAPNDCRKVARAGVRGRHEGCFDRSGVNLSLSELSYTQLPLLGHPLPPLGLTAVLKNLSTRFEPPATSRAHCSAQKPFNAVRHHVRG